MKFSFNYIELCKTTDKQSHYFVSEAQRNGLSVVEINNKQYALVINEMVYRAPNTEFKNIGSGIYVFKE